MKAYDVLGYTADADCWCETCAEEEYGPDEDGRTDKEGNEVHPIFPGDEGGECVCGKCGAVIGEEEDVDEDEA